MLDSRRIMSSDAELARDIKTTDSVSRHSNLNFILVFVKDYLNNLPCAGSALKAGLLFLDRLLWRLLTKVKLPSTK